MQPSHFPRSPGGDIGLGIRNVSRSGNYDRPAREGRGAALFGDQNACPGDQDEATGRSKPNSTRPGRSLHYLNDRMVAGASPTEYGKHRPHYEEEEKIKDQTRKVSVSDAPD
jgi:hypothetical protein